MAQYAHVKIKPGTIITRMSDQYLIQENIT